MCFWFIIQNIMLLELFKCLAKYERETTVALTHEFNFNCG